MYTCLYLHLNLGWRFRQIHLNIFWKCTRQLSLVHVFFFFHSLHESSAWLDFGYKHKTRGCKPSYKRGLCLLHSWTNETNMTNIKPGQAWQMALPLFNGVVKSGYSQKTPFQCGVSEFGSIKSQFSTQSDMQTFVLWSFGKNMTDDSEPVSICPADKQHCWTLDALRDGVWGITPFYLWVMCSRAANAAYARWSQTLKGCWSCYYHSADWPIPSPIVIQQNGNLVSREMLIEFS